jgi:hypothetical protein
MLSRGAREARCSPVERKRWSGRGTDALGATFGAGGLIVFAVVVWLCAGRAQPSLVLGGTLLARTIASCLIWRLLELLL